MKELIMFHRNDCGYCLKAKRALEELYAENPAYAAVPLTMIEETEQPALADTYDYYAVPSFFIGKDKLFEARIGMSQETIKAAVKAALNAAMA